MMQTKQEGTSPKETHQDDLSLDDAFDLLQQERKKAEIPEHIAGMIALEGDDDFENPHSEEKMEEAGMYAPEVEDWMEEAEGIAYGLDWGVGVTGNIITGQDEGRYQKFLRKSPPEHYIRAWAKVLQKYQMRTDPESILLISILLLYFKPGMQMYQDYQQNGTTKEAKK